MLHLLVDSANATSLATLQKNIDKNLQFSQIMCNFAPAIQK